MSLSFTITEIIPLPISIPGQALPEEEVGTVFPSVYGAQNIDFNTTFSFVETSEMGEVTYPIVEITPTDLPIDKGVTLTVISSNTTKLSGNIVNVFLGEYYQFLLRDGTVKNLSPNNAEDWVTLVGWGRPSSNKATLEYAFDVKYETAPSTTVTTTASITQEVFWSFDTGLSTFRQLLSEGEF